MMDRFGRTDYDTLAWAGGTTSNFTKPRFDDIPQLKTVSLGDRLPVYSEFYELQTYLDVLGALKPGRLLDVGAGSGSLSNMFSLLGWQAIACDYDAAAFKFSTGRFVKADLNKDLPFESGEFDAIVCKQVVEHLENPNHLLREFHRVLREGSSVMLSTPNIASLRGRWAFMRSGLPLFFENHWRDHRMIPHYGQLKSMLEEFGFTDIRSYTNRYEMFNLNGTVNGSRMRFVVPILKFISRDNLPEECRYGECLMLSAVRLK